MTVAGEDPIAELKALMERMLPSPEHGDYAEFLDDEERWVALRRANGALVMTIPADLYERLRAKAREAATFEATMSPRVTPDPLGSLPIIRPRE